LFALTFKVLKNQSFCKITLFNLQLIYKLGNSAFAGISVVNFCLSITSRKI